MLRSRSEGNNGNIMVDIKASHQSAQCTATIPPALHCPALHWFCSSFLRIFVVSSDSNCCPAPTARALHLLALHSSGSPKQSFPMFFSSLPQSEGKSSSLPSALSELMVLGPKKTLLTPLVIGLETQIVRQISDVRGEMGEGGGW